MRQSAYKRTETEFLFDLKHTHNFDEISIEKSSQLPLYLESKFTVQRNTCQFTSLVFREVR